MCSSSTGCREETCLCLSGELDRGQLCDGGDEPDDIISNSENFIKNKIIEKLRYLYDLRTLWSTNHIKNLSKIRNIDQRFSYMARVLLRSIKYRFNRKTLVRNTYTLAVVNLSRLLDGLFYTVHDDAI